MTKTKMIKKCKLCKKAFFIFQLNNRGLCKECNIKESNFRKRSLDNKIRIINESINIINKTKNDKTKASRKKVIITMVDRIMKDEKRGIYKLKTEFRNMLIELKTKFSLTQTSEV